MNFMDDHCPSSKHYLRLASPASITPSSVRAPIAVTEPADRPRFLSEAACHDIAARLTRFSQGGGYTTVLISSTWHGSVRWARNVISMSSNVRNSTVNVERNINGATSNTVLINDTTDAALIAAVRRAERMTEFRNERPSSDLVNRAVLEAVPAPSLFSESTYQLSADQRAAAAHVLMQSASAAGMLSAGFIDVSAHSQAIIDSFGRSWYFQYTQAQYSVTVRNPAGTGSGWAGVDWHDWAKIDAPALLAVALDKCMKSQNPVTIEPGRYTAILEPQATGDFVGQLTFGEWWPPSPLDRKDNERGNFTFSKSRGFSKLGQKVMDERITISADPMDPDLGFPPFDLWYDTTTWEQNRFAKQVFHPVTWIDHGVLTNLAYDLDYGRRLLGVNQGLPNGGAMRMSGGTTAIEEMIATTKRGVLVTRFDRIQPIDTVSLLVRGNTRDGVWLIEHGKITKPVKNLVFTESIFGALNNVEQLGVPQRVFHPPGQVFMAFPQPVIAPPIKIRDFSFTALCDAV